MSSFSTMFSKKTFRSFQSYCQAYYVPYCIIQYCKINTQLYHSNIHIHMDRETLKRVACEAIDAAKDELYDLSDKIWKNPELGFQERFAHDTLTKFLTDQGFETKCSFKLETAFKASYSNGSGSTGPTVGFVSEYDALPNIGHACGHNLIAELGVAAGIGLKAAMKAYGKPCGQVIVLGTPAEEGLGGKVELINAGAFQDIDVMMMSHPFPKNDPIPVFFSRENFRVTFHGKSSHAAGFPWEGINALDAAVMCYNNMACLRQQIKPSHRIHCIMLEGGVRINIIPEKAVLEIAVRAPTDAERIALKQRVLNCVGAAAMATGCTVDHETKDKIYSSVLHNKPMTELYESNLAPFLTDDIPRERGEYCASTDMGNVSQIMPSIHPNFHIGGKAVNHTKEFTSDTGDVRAQIYTLCQAKALAMTGVDIMFEPQLLKAVKDSFKKETQLKT